MFAHTYTLAPLLYSGHLTYWNGEWGRSRDGCRPIRWVEIVEEEGEVSGVNVGRPVVTHV